MKLPIRCIFRELSGLAAGMVLMAALIAPSPAEACQCWGGSGERAKAGQNLETLGGRLKNSALVCWSHGQEARGDDCRPRKGWGHHTGLNIFPTIPYAPMALRTVRPLRTCPGFGPGFFIQRSGIIDRTEKSDTEQRLHQPRCHALEAQRRIGHGEADAVLALGSERLVLKGFVRFLQVPGAVGAGRVSKRAA